MCAYDSFLQVESRGNEVEIRGAGSDLLKSAKWVENANQFSFMKIISLKTPANCNNTRIWQHFVNIALTIHLYQIFEMIVDFSLNLNLIVLNQVQENVNTKAKIILLI